MKAAKSRWYRVPSSITTIDSTGPFGVYSPGPELPRMLRPRKPALEFHDLAMDDIPVGHTTLFQAGLRVNSEDVGCYGVEFWQRIPWLERAAPSIMPADLRSVFLRVELPKPPQWISDTYALYQSRPEAEAAANAIHGQSDDRWFAYSLCELRRIPEGVAFERVHTALFIPNVRNEQ